MFDVYYRRRAGITRGGETDAERCFSAKVTLLASLLDRTDRRCGELKRVGWVDAEAINRIVSDRSRNVITTIDDAEMDKLIRLTNEFDVLVLILLVQEKNQAPRSRQFFLGKKVLGPPHPRTPVPGQLA